MSKTLPWKAIFFVGFLLGAGIVMAVSFAPGDAGTVSDNVTVGAPDGMNATIQGETDVVLESDTLFPSSDTVQFKTESGNITFQSSGPAWASVHKDNITGTYTTVQDIDATQNYITINPETKQSVTVGGNVDHVSWRDSSGVAVDDLTTDFRYGGASGTSEVTIGGVPANTQVAAIDRDTNAVLDVATSDGSGQVTFDSLDNSDHNVILQTTDGGPSLSNLQDDGSVRYQDQQLSVEVADADFPNYNVTLEWYVDGNLEATTYATSGGTKSVTVGPIADGDHEYSVEAADAYGQSDSIGPNTFTIDHYDPQIANIQPQGDLDAEPADISADISDQDFGNDGDTLTVDISLDGSQIDSQTINSDGTVTASMPSSGQTGGSHTVTFEVTDSYGQTESTTVTYRTPDELTIRNETDYDQLVPADGEVRFFAENQVYSRSAPNGRVNMTGLPVNQDFIVEVDPTSDDYTERAIYIQSIYEQQAAYVLNSTAYPTVESRFVLEDPTGQYDSETVLQIRQIINVSGTASYQAIVADEFGTEGVTATLQERQRYELSVIGETGTQSVGPYRADTSETVAVRPDSPSINVTQGEDGYAYGADLDNTTLEYQYVDPQQDTTQLTVWIHERGNKSNLLQPNETAFDIGNYSGIATLSQSQKNTEWVVKFVVVRNGETFVVQQIVNSGGDLTPPVGSNWLQIIGISVLILFAGAFSVLNARIGALILSLVGGILWFVGFLGTAATGATVTVAIFISVIGYMRGQ